MKLIPLTQGKFAKVDDEDFKRVNEYKWCYSGHGYAYRKMNGKHVYMHTFISGYPITDHKDMDGLNNQRNNLREATKSTNGMNRKMSTNNVCGFKGVVKSGKTGWVARLETQGTKIYLGTFRTKELAARAYDEKAKELFGEFAHLNFP